MTIIRAILGLLIAGLGMVLGLLFAPTSGKDLRSKLFSDSGVKKGSGKTLVKEFGDMGSDLSKTAKTVYRSKTVQRGLKKGKLALKKGLHEAEKYGEEAVEFVQDKVVSLSHKAKKPVAKKAKKSTKKSK